MSGDVFLGASPAVRDFARNGRGQPLVIPPGGGKPISYNRPSSWGKKIEDTFGLEMWQRRMVVVGMSRTPSLVARACAISPDPKTWSQADREALNAIADEAQTAAKSNQAADIGTAVHKMTERIDLGEELTDLPEPFASDIAAYRAGMTYHGLVADPALVECRLVCDELRLAGSADRIIRPRVFDLKTGATVSAAALGFAVQLAIYAHSELYNVETGERTKLDLDQRTALVGHLPAGQATFTLYEVDIAAGWEAALLAADIDRWRKRKGLIAAVPAPSALTPAAQIACVRLNPEEGETADLAAFAALRAKYQALTSTQQDWVNRVGVEATQHHVSFHSGAVKTVRRFEILRGLITLAKTLEPGDLDECLRATLAAVLGEHAWFSHVTAGHLAGSLTADEAAAFAQRCDALLDLAA